MQIKGIKERIEEFLNEFISVLPKFDGITYTIMEHYFPTIYINFNGKYIDKITFNHSNIFTINSQSFDKIDDEFLEFLEKRVKGLIKRHSNLLTKAEVDKEKKAYEEVMEFLKSCIKEKEGHHGITYKIPEADIYIYVRTVNWTNAYNEVGKPKHQSTATRCLDLGTYTMGFSLGGNGFKPSKFKNKLKAFLKE